MFQRQMWMCTQCHTKRQWGYGAASDSSYEPLLLCEGTCGKEVAGRKLPIETRHRYAGVSAEFSSSSTKRGELITA